MTSLVFKKLNLSNHKTNCRICLNPFTAQNQALRIGYDVEKRYSEIFQNEFLISPNFSKRICVSCDGKLKEISTFVENVKFLQQKLFDFVESEVCKEFEEPIVNVDAPKDVKCEEIFVKCEPEEIPEFQDNFNFDAELELQKASEFIASLEMAPKDKVTVVSRKRKLGVSKGAARKSKKIKLDSKSAVENQQMQTTGEIISQGRMCMYCGKLFSCRIKVEIHIAGVHLKSKQYACDLCPYGCATKTSIQAHVKTHIAMEYRKIHKCHLCDYVGPSKVLLKVHMGGVHSTQTFTCFCGMTFRTKPNLVSHNLRVHEKIQRYKCSDCDNSFFGSNELTYHRNRLHKKEKQYKCTECGEGFLTPTNLSNHRIKKHTLKYQCKLPDCGKILVSQMRLKEHMNLHNGVRDKQCHLCEKAYFSTCKLRLHLDVVHGRKTYYCELCDFTNSRRDYLGNHLKNHHKLDQTEMLEVLKRAKVVQREV